MRNFKDFIDKEIAVSFADETEHNIWGLRNCAIKTVLNGKQRNYHFILADKIFKAS